MSGRFIVSLDCEGKWGMADALQPYHHRLLTDEALARVYAEIVTRFAAHAVPATFAFVMAFTLTAEEQQQFADILADTGRRDDWLSHFWSEQREGRAGGWFQPQALETVRADPRHEIASHSFCHRDLADAAISEEEAEAELDSAAAAARLKGIQPRTFVFPRNSVGHVSLLRRKGYIGYRLARPPVSRLRALAAELYLWPRAEISPPAAPGAPIAIPAGYFLNWRFGPRRYIPRTVTARRWKTLIDRACETGGVAHLWFHPHNLITAPSTRDTLDEILAYASAQRSAGRLRMLTQEQYCEELLAGAEPTS
ncbi:MAG TPA: polysaccharide deacetylase family protein [Allosphingosinicella sp.]|nr:polysaccharide deacetylase family protein [Allosphingosinicella sp.]